MRGHEGILLLLESKGYENIVESCVMRAHPIPTRRLFLAKAHSLLNGNCELLL